MSGKIKSGKVGAALRANARQILVMVCEVILAAQIHPVNFSELSQNKEVNAHLTPFER